MTFKRLLAKSTLDENNPQRGESFQGHIAEVIRAADCIGQARAEASLRAAGLPVGWRERLGSILWLAAFIHDLGKCSEHFQEMVRGKRKAQLLRHEAASLWLCWPGQPLAEWLQGAVGSEEDYRVAVIAAAAHHRKFWELAFSSDTQGAGIEMKLLCGHRDFQDTLRLAGLKKSLGTPPTLGDLSVQDSSRASASPRKLFSRWQREAEEQFAPGREVSKLLSITKALLICADVAGSALPRQAAVEALPKGWLGDQFQDGDLAPELRSIIGQRLEGRPLRPFQEQVASSDAPVTLATAGCGSGKTVAALAWAAEQHPRRRLWLTYPTTGTATEGFRDYFDPSALNARLIHGRSEVDVELFDLRDGDDEGQRYQDRLASLREWGLDAITCTVDTVLGLIQNNRRGVYAWPNLAQGAVVFDEIHAYDDQLFGALLRFLEALPGIPALLMTASLPAHRERALQELCSRVHGRPLARVAGPADLEQLPRYRLHDGDHDLATVVAEIEAQRAAGGKVLWVSNTVDRCHAAAAQIDGALRYHSRFRYADRVERHRDVINAFNPNKNGGFTAACTTQVAEMSLDLSADLLVTDLAPIPAMIQRLGRLNRRSHPAAPAPIKRFLVLRPGQPLPYTQAQLDEAERWLGQLRGRDLSQRDLVDAWQQPDEGVAAPCASSWLDGGFCTTSTPLREAGDGIAVLLPGDRADVLAKRSKPVEVAVPMNRPPRGWEKWERSKQTGYLLVPPPEAITYDPREGARWVK